MSIITLGEQWNGKLFRGTLLKLVFGVIRMYVGNPNRRKVGETVRGIRLLGNCKVPFFSHFLRSVGRAPLPPSLLHPDRCFQKIAPIVSLSRRVGCGCRSFYTVQRYFPLPPSSENHPRPLRPFIAGGERGFLRGSVGLGRKGYRHCGIFRQFGAKGKCWEK